MYEYHRGSSVHSLTSRLDSCGWVWVVHAGCLSLYSLPKKISMKRNASRWGMWSPIHSLHHFHPVTSTSSTCPLRALELVMHLLCFILFPHNNHILHMVRGIVTGLWGKAPTHATSVPMKTLAVGRILHCPTPQVVRCLHKYFTTGPSHLGLKHVCAVLSPVHRWQWSFTLADVPKATLALSSEILALGRGFLQGSKVVYLPLSLHPLDAGAHVQYLHKERTRHLKGHRCVYPEK